LEHYVIKRKSNWTNSINIEDSINFRMSKLSTF